MFYFKCFRLVLKSKGNASLFSNFAWRTDTRGERSGGQGQPSQTEIYYRIVHFYSFKCFPLVLKNRRNASLSFKFCFADGYAAGRSGGQGQPSQTEIYYRIVHFYNFNYFLLILKGKGNAHRFFNFLWRTDGRGAGGRRGQT